MDGDSGCSWVGWGRSLVLNLLGSSFDVAVIFLEKIPRKIGDVVEDFELVREEFVAEYASQARLWKHKKTGTELLSILNADENKTFGIVFRTPPKDSTGVPHILEHSVLCGSRKYPVKEPFVELIKSSLNTFLNAFTFPDKTCYPVASCNEQDFYNLVDVYMDAVLHPAMTPDTLRQEGHHFELDDIDGKMTIKGVVYNEMKGAYSDPERVLAEYSQEAIFPDITYGVESGGHPRDIPDLTWEQFKGFHDSYYHPSNARVWFYGDDDEGRRLKKVNEFLQEFEKIDISSSAVPLQERWTEPRAIEHTYDCGSEGDPSNKFMTTLNWMLTPMDQTEPEKILALTVLSQLLLSTSASPLRKALTDSGLGEDIVGGGLETDLRQMSFSVGMKGLTEENVAKVQELIEETLTQLSKEGVPQTLMESCLNTLEFRLRENNTGRFPRGLSLMIASLSTWLHESDPLVPLRFEEPLMKLKEKLAAGESVFEDLIRENFLTNPHKAAVTMIPDPKYAEKEAAIEQERIDKVAKAASREELEEIVEMTQRLKEKQAKPDDPAELAKIPYLSKEDLDKNMKTVPFEEDQISGATVYHHPLPTSGVVYMDLGLDISGVSMELLPLMSLYTESLTQLGTKKEDFVSLQQRIGRETGGLRPSTYMSQLVAADGNGPVVSMLMIRAKTMSSKTTQTFDLLKDILLEPNFDNKERFRQLVVEEKAGVESGIAPSGHTVAAGRLRSQYRVGDWATEQMEGLAYLDYVKALLERVDNDWEGVLRDLRALHSAVVHRSKLVCNVTTDSDVYPGVKAELKSFLDSLPEKSSLELPSWIDQAPTPTPANEGFIIPAQVNYVGKAMNLLDAGYELTGASALAAKHLGTSYLWDTVRVQGGAYGGFCRLDMRTGDFLYLSYRDPNVNKTLTNYDGAGAFLKSHDISEEELTKSIIGMIGDMDSYALPDAKGFASMTRKITGETDELRQERREQVLGATAKDFKEFGEALDATKESGSVVVVGSETSLNAAKEEGLDISLSQPL
mmetsp:Transcript_28951/g.112649  ORF Transcript_28951/g.112649 Transcript_28951/m.112649 type:complete len:1021 (-) Transcript_28951:1221-4283(-)